MLIASRIGISKTRQIDQLAVGAWDMRQRSLPEVVDQLPAPADVLEIPAFLSILVSGFDRSRRRIA